MEFMDQTKTLDFYDSQADEFARSTQSVDFSDAQNRFASKLKDHDLILDLGCGAGRDSKAFLEMGFEVEAVDGSFAMCAATQAFAGIPVKQMLFEELDEREKYDGIWACASILHLLSSRLPLMLKKIADALKPDGVFYTSFKYGTFEGERNGRYFTDLTEDSFAEMILPDCPLVIEEQWISHDVRPGRKEQKWLNLILRKKPDLMKAG